MLGMDTQSLNGEKLVFLHHIDGFEANAIKKLLMEENSNEKFGKYRLFGTVYRAENFGRIMTDTQPVEFFNPTYDNYITRIIECDVLIFNADSTDFEKVCSDLRRVLLALEEWAKEKSISSEPEENAVPFKYLILISTPMTWELTTPIIDENNVEEEDEEEAAHFLYEDDYRRRKAHKSYCKHKLLERDVIWIQKRCRNLVRSLVVCPGVVYGEENNTFHYIFKLAFYNKQVPIMRPGSQIIPMIYVKDFAQIIVNFVNQFPEAKTRYIFAVQPTMIPLKTFTYEICKRLSGDCSKIRFLREIEMLLQDSELFPQSVLDVLGLDLKLTPTYLKDFPFHEINDEFWDELVQEFRDARNLHPLKIVVDGPPLVGKTEHARKLGEFYQLFYIDIRQVMNTYVQYLEEKINDSIIVIESFQCPDQILLNADGEEEDYRTTLPEDKSGEGEEEHVYDQEDEQLIANFKEKVEKLSKILFTFKVYLASHKTFEDQEFEYILLCLIGLLSTKMCNENQGYIIDGFPFTYNEASQIYYNTQQLDGLNFPSLENVDELNNNDTANFPLKPSHFVMLDATDCFLCNRAMGYTETEATIRRCLRHQMLPRLDAYRERNEEPNCLANIFYDHELIPISIFLEANSLFVDSLRSIKMEIGSPFIYPLSPVQQEAVDRKRADELTKEEMMELRKKEELTKALRVERERKLLHWSAKYEEIRKHENELREVKTLPLRQYLGKYVLPTLTEGILKIAELKPDDPIDFLAEYLFKCNPEGQQMPPFCTEQQRAQFYDSFFEEMTSNSDFVVENVDRYGCSEHHGHQPPPAN